MNGDERVKIFTLAEWNTDGASAGSGVMSRSGGREEKQFITSPRKKKKEKKNNNRKNTSKTHEMKL